MKIKKKIVLALIALLLLSLFYINLSWLAEIICAIILFRIGFKYLVKSIKNKIIKKTINTVCVVLMIVSVSVCIRVFVFSIFLIPSSSMENTLYPKDVILVNKLCYGPQLPQSPYEIPWINIWYSLRNSSKDIIDKESKGSKRLSGITDIKKGDVVVFKVSDNGSFIVKRCVAVTGDTLSIVNGKVYNNGIKNNDFPHIRDTYKFKINNFNQFFYQLDSLNLGVDVSESENLINDWMYAKFTKAEVKRINGLSTVDTLQIKITETPINVSRFRWYKEKKWTLDNYGSIVIPKKGMEIILTKDNIMFYKYIIRKHEKVKFREKKGKCYVDGKLATSYVFKYDYYFMMGDNRHNSQDSRYFGMIPKEKIVGKVQCVLFSTKDNHFNWDRLFKAI